LPKLEAPAFNDAERHPAKRFTNQDLPAGCQDHSYWRHRFIPTYLQFVGAFADPWSIPDTDSLAALRKAWAKVYGQRIVYKVTAHDAVFTLVSFLIQPLDSYVYIYQSAQRVYEWRSTFGTSAVMTVNSFFLSKDNGFHTDQDRASHAKYLLENRRFIYSNPEVSF
jgi:hypothetical protein